jgi:hypothetical protein
MFQYVLNQIKENLSQYNWVINQYLLDICDYEKFKRELNKKFGISFLFNLYFKKINVIFLI